MYVSSGIQLSLPPESSQIVSGHSGHSFPLHHLLSPNHPYPYCVELIRSAGVTYTQYARDCVCLDEPLSHQRSTVESIASIPLVNWMDLIQRVVQWQISDVCASDLPEIHCVNISHYKLTIDDKTDGSGRLRQSQANAERNGQKAELGYLFTIT